MDMERSSTRKRISRIKFGAVLLLALTLSIVPGLAYAQWCGSFDGVGPLTSQDLAHTAQYLFLGGPPPANPALADCDSYQLITLRDAQAIYWYLFQGGPALVCPATNPSQPVLDSGIVVEVSGTASANSEMATVDVWFTNDITISAFCLPLQILLDGQPVSINSITDSDLTDGWDLPSSMINRIEPAASVAMIAGANYFRPTPDYFLQPGTHYMGSIIVSYESEVFDREFSFDWKAISPIAPISGYPDTSLIPVAVGLYAPSSPDKDGSLAEPLAQYLPLLEVVTSSCCALAGDADDNDLVTISDAVYLINYIFSSGMPPHCPASADGDGSGFISISDAVAMINYIFASGNALVCGQ